MIFSFAPILPLLDMLALGWFFLCWVGYAYYADQRRWGTRELASVLHTYRLRCMTRVLERENGSPSCPEPGAAVVSRLDSGVRRNDEAKMVRALGDYRRPASADFLRKTETALTITLPAPAS